MARRVLEVGTKDECRFCDMPLVWGPPDPEYPFDKMWYHPHRPIEDDWEKSQIFCYDISEGSEGRWARKVGQPKAFCTVMKADYSGPCHAPVVDDELFMCGTHSKKEHQHLRSMEASAEKRGIQRTMHDFLEPLCDHLNGFYDLEARAERTGTYGGEYTGYLVVNPAKLVDLIAKIEEEF